MKQLALEVVARTLDLQQIRLLTEEFDRADKTNDGEVRPACDKFIEHVVHLVFL